MTEEVKRTKTEEIVKATNETETAAKKSSTDHETVNPFDNNTGKSLADTVTPVQLVQPAQTGQRSMGYQQTAQPMTQVDPEAQLKGVAGWLAFFVVVFGINSFSYLVVFISSLASMLDGDTTGSTIAMAIVTPIAGVALLLAAVNIAMRRKLGKTLSQIALAISGVGIAILALVSLFTDTASVEYGYDYYGGSYANTASSPSASAIVLTLGWVVIELVIYGLVCLYFQQSRRVKKTLTE